MNGLRIVVKQGDKINGEMVMFLYLPMKMSSVQKTKDDL